MGFWHFTAVIFTCLIGTTGLSWAEESFASEDPSQNWIGELRQIDDEIDRAEDLQNRYRAAARRAEDEGMRWQFMQNEKQEAKRAFQRADEKKKAAQMLQPRIDALKARRAQLLKEHPEANGVQ